MFNVLVPYQTKDYRIQRAQKDNNMEGSLGGNYVLECGIPKENLPKIARQNYAKKVPQKKI